MPFRFVQVSSIRHSAPSSPEAGDTTAWAGIDSEEAEEASTLSVRIR